MRCAKDPCLRAGGPCSSACSPCCDFSGNYAAGEAGIAVAGGPSDVVMKNENGVVLHLHGMRQGVRLTLAAQGVSLKLKS
jgi:hypothetical protein